MTFVEEAALRLAERLTAFMPDPVLDFFLQAIAVMSKRSQETLRWDERGSGWRRMLDPTRCPAWALPWVAQLVGSPNLSGLTEEQQRAVVADSPTLRRGTPASIRAAAQMHGPEDVLIVERVDSAYTLLVQTHTLQTPDPDLVEAAVRAAKPAGLVLTYVCSDDLLVGVFEGLSDWATAATFEAAFADVDDFETYTT
jgi:hypothetical protein